jgi:hypothetical protein
MWTRGIFAPKFPSKDARTLAATLRLAPLANAKGARIESVSVAEIKAEL